MSRENFLHWDFRGRGGVGPEGGGIILSNLEPFARSARNGAVRCSPSLPPYLFLLGHFSGVHSILLCLGSMREDGRRVEGWGDDSGQKWVKRSDSGPFTRHLSLFLACQDKEDGYPLCGRLARGLVRSVYWENGSAYCIFTMGAPQR